MNLAQGLKERARMVRRINELRAYIAANNSHRTDEKPAHDVGALVKELGERLTNLYDLKEAIIKANVGITKTLIVQAEYKGELAWLRSIRITEGLRDVGPRYSAEKPERVMWEATITEAERSKRMAELQKAIDTMQDEIDAYNHKTEVAYR